MGKKKGGKGGGDAKVEAKSKGDGENKKKDGENGVTAVLKMDMHCEGCADKIVKLAKSIDGVEKAKADWEANKLTVRGEMLDPLELREELQEKTKKKVDLVSPQLPKKEKDGDNKSSPASSDNNKKAKDKKPEDKKPKEPPVTTVVLKLDLHCSGCIDKIYKIVSKAKGVQSIDFDKDKDLVMVTGAVDAKALVESLKEKIKRPVEVVQPKKDKEEGGGGGGKKNKKGGGNGGKEGGDDAAAGYGGDHDGAEESYGGAGEYFGGNIMEHNRVPPGYMYNYGFMYGNPGNPLHAPQMFSDENPNACRIM
ncbi:heavy metal-associated isoprenylated plant protein 3-like isoform X2 [Rhodamnia argentea]|uniref:Heavy metal-associated isoprenylated plant protein 3-like isoform X2 n=1 Tax=Rhodamnia argentea TaxID=178133 RepID=A0A8B8NYC5_9MYRT|nr:heavy metal-associated isoprenylated plant protein 3-like isoform X2 [Rhodamnia argentea]